MAFSSKLLRQIQMRLLSCAQTHSSSPPKAISFLPSDTRQKSAFELLRLFGAEYQRRGSSLEALFYVPEVTRAVIQALEALPLQATRCSNAHLLAAYLYRRQGNDIAAFHLLMRSQMDHLRSGRLHLMIADLFRDDGDFERAYVYIKLAERLKVKNGPIRRLAFEVNNQFFDDGEETLDRILNLDDAEVRPYLPMLNRISPFYPGRATALRSVRERAQKELCASKLNTTRRVSRAIEMAIGCRWIQDARKIAESSVQKGVVVNPKTEKWLKRVEADLGRLSGVLDIAWNNEHCENLLGMTHGMPRPVHGSSFSADKVVEFFIPTPFFSKPTDEKPTYSAVRKIFSTIGNDLLDRGDLMVVPRLQLNWRYCHRRLSGRAVSYHTKTQRVDRLHLHIQESPFHGYCSMDTQGFSGYSSISTDHSKVAAAVGGVSDSSLQENHEQLRHRFISKNISKYTQKLDNEPLPDSYVFIPLQVQTDIVSSLAWVDGLSLVRNVADFYRASDTKVVVKRHPYCASMTVQRTLEELVSRGYVIVTTNSIHDVISKSRAVFTVNSGVGLEALVHLKPVVVSGACDFSYAANSVRSVNELWHLLEKGPHCDTRRALELLYYYMNFYTVPVDNDLLIHSRLDSWLST